MIRKGQGVTLSLFCHPEGGTYGIYRICRIL